MLGIYSLDIYKYTVHIILLYIPWRPERIRSPGALLRVRGSSGGGLLPAWAGTPNLEGGDAARIPVCFLGRKTPEGAVPPPVLPTPR